MEFNRKRTVRITFWILAIVLILSLLVVYLRYLDLRKVFLQKVSEKATLLIGQGVHIENLSISYSLSANLYGIAIKNPEGFAPGELLRVRRVQLEVRLGKLLKGEISIKSMRLYSPELSLVTDAKEKWNISDALLRLLSTRSTTKYKIDELRIDSGAFELNRDARFRSDHINLLFENISSGPGTRTGIKGTIGYAGNRVDIDGWTSFNEVPMKVNLSISSRDFVLSQLGRFLERYKIDTRKMRLSFYVQAEGDTERGFHISSNLFLKGFQSFSFRKDLRDIQLRTDGMFSLRDYSLALNHGSLLMNGTSAATFRGKIIRLNESPSYVGDIKLDRLDLSRLHFIKEMKVSGMLSSENIRVAGDFGSKTPEVFGDLRLREGGIESSEIAKDIVTLASSRIGPDKFLYFEVSEENNPRESFSINMYRAKLPLKELSPSLLKICQHYSIPSEEFHTQYDPMKGQLFGHLSGGIDREGRDFLTVYFGEKGSSR